MKLRWWLDLRNTRTRLKDKVFHQGKQRHRHQFGEITLGKTLFFSSFHSLQYGLRCRRCCDENVTEKKREKSVSKKGAT